MTISRRDFVAETGKVALGAMIVPRFVLGGPGHRAPSDKLNVAFCGIGGMGMQNMSRFLDENIVAICDVDFPYVERSLAGRLRSRDGKPPSEEALKLKAAYEKAAKYDDFREMLVRQKDIDAVVVATPDHLHAVIASAAMRAGKHVYVQKPLTYSVFEARELARIARETGVVTQMGNQGHSMDGTRRVKEIVASGLLGTISAAHVWTDRPVRYWAQGIPRPDPAADKNYGTVEPRDDGRPVVPPRWNMRTVERAVLAAMARNPQTPPEGLHWDLLVGPAADVAYHPAYHPFSWRGWLDFGVGAIGDMGAHLIDQAFWALDLDYPTSITSSSSPWGGSAENPATYPLAMMAQYEFPARNGRPPVNLYWYDGGLMPPRPPFIPTGEALARGDGGGGVIVGDRGIITYETYGNNPKVWPASLAAEAEQIPVTVPRIAVPHEVNFAQACKGEARASAPFEYSAALTETMLLPIVALRAGQGTTILYDAPNMTVTNIPTANQYLKREFRAGWSL